MWLESTKDHVTCEKCGSRVSKLTYKRYHGAQCILLDDPEIVRTRAEYTQAYSDFVAALVEVNNYHRRFLKSSALRSGTEFRHTVVRLQKLCIVLRNRSKDMAEAFDKKKREVEAKEPPKKYKKKNVDIPKSSSGDSS